MRKKFYHLAWLLLAAIAPAPAAEPPAAVVEPVALPAPPPRRIDDIEQLLGHYKPDTTVAAQVLREADAQPPATDDRSALFKFYWDRGRAATKAGRVSQQIADLRRARELADQGSPDHTRVQRELATAELVGGNILNATRLIEDVAKFTPMRQMGQLLGAHHQAAHFYVQLGDLESARRHLREAESAFVMVRRGQGWTNFGHSWTATIERARAEVFKGEGRYLEAEGALRRALRAQQSFLPEHDRLLEERSGYNAAKDSALHYREVLERGLATVLLLQGKVAEAEAVARQALRHALERVGRNSTDVAMALFQMSRILGEQGRNDEALRLAEESLRSFELAGTAPESVFMANARKALGAVLVARGGYREADRMFELAREGLRADPEVAKKIGGGDLDWVQAMLRLGKQAEAEKMARSMVDSAAKKYPDQPQRIAERRAYLAMALAARGARQEALAAFREAVPLLIDKAREDAEGENGTVKRQRQLVTVLEAYLKLLAEVAGKPEAAGLDAPAEAFRMADIARGSAVQRALTASAARANLGDPKLADLARREQDTQRRVKALSELLTQLLSAPPEQQLPKVQADMQRDIDRLRQERTALRKEIAERFPDYAELVDPKPASLDQARKFLRPGEALAAFYFGEDQGYVWALAADGRTAFATIAITRAELARQVANLRLALDPGVADLEKVPDFDVAAGHRLYRQLLEPVESVWKDAKVLLVVPHAALGQLPLALLPMAAVPPARAPLLFAGYKEVPWLLRRLAVAQLPSVTALASLRKLPAGDASRRPFIGFGDPLFSLAQAKEVGAVPGGPAMRGRKAASLRSAVRTAFVNSASLALLPRLPDTNQEIREIAKVLGAGGDEDLYLQTRATVKAVLETDLSRRRVVMFATHGLVPGDLDGLTQPALALTSPDVAGGDGNGLLTMDEVLTLKLNADWVVLSACNTAAGEGAGAEAVSGLGRAFFYAGGRALLVSNWPVETEAARLIMTELFRRQAARGDLAKAEALRQSMLALIDGPGSVDPKTGKADYAHAHPLFWAPFVVVGD